MYYNIVAEGCRRKILRVNLEVLYEGLKLGESVFNTCLDFNVSVSTCENFNGFNGNFVIRRLSFFVLRRNFILIFSDLGCSGLSFGIIFLVLKDSFLF